MKYDFLKLALTLVGVILICQACQTEPLPVAPVFLPSPTQTLAENYPTRVPTRTPLPTSTIRPSPIPLTATPVKLIPGLLPVLPTQPPSLPGGINPLTGLPPADPQFLDRRPILVKVSNYPRTGRPHAGLSFADIVFEYYIGEFTNRFSALYYGQYPPKSGPIRSGRLVDAQLTNMYGGILVYGNADPVVEEVLIRSLGDRQLASKNMPCPPVCYEGAATVTNLFADVQKVEEYITRRNINNSRPDLSGMFFDIIPPKSNEFAVSISMEYAWFNRGEWRYDPEKQIYNRWIEEVDTNNKVSMVPLVDRLTNKQLAVSNLILLFATYKEFKPTLHDVDFSTNQSGKRAIVFRDAVAIDGLWKFVDSHRPIQFFTRSGSPIPLRPGNTWIIIVGDKTSLQQPSPGQWEAKFGLP